LPLIRLLDTVSAEDRMALVAVLSRSGNHHRETLEPWLERSDAISYARQKAAWFTRRAGGELAALPATSACNSLRGLTEFVVTRHQ